MFLGEGHPACLQACVGEASEEGFPFPDDPLFRRGGKEPSLSRGARQGLEAEMETCWALSGRGAECWRTPAASSEPSAARPVTSCAYPLRDSPRGAGRGVRSARGHRHHSYTSERVWTAPGCAGQRPLIGRLCPAVA